MRATLRRHGTWAVAASADCGLEVEPIDCGVVATGVGSAFFNYLVNFSPVAAGDTGVDNPATVVRIVGDQHVAGAWFLQGGATGDITTMHIIEMWYIGDIDNTGAVIPKDPTNAFDIKSSDIMHMRSSLFVQTGSGAKGFSLCENRVHEGSYIDFRVKRKLRQEEEIVYAVTAVTDIVRGGAGPITATVNVYGNVRAYVLS